MTDGILIRFRLVGDEARALRELSTTELRSPRDQARYILVRELVRCGLLPVADQQDEFQTQEVGGGGGSETHGSHRVAGI